MTDEKVTAGPYRAEFGAIHREDAAGFLFTVAPAAFADDVADALNAKLALQAEGDKLSGEVESLHAECLQWRDDLYGAKQERQDAWSAQQAAEAKLTALVEAAKPFARWIESARGAPWRAGPVLTSNDGAVITVADFDAIRQALAHHSAPVGEAKPIPMLLFCPKCGVQHVDAPEPDAVSKMFTAGIDGQPVPWTNPPHKSHLCHACGCIWRPADVPTEGVKAIETRGKVDNWWAYAGTAAPAPPSTPTSAPVEDVGGPEDHTRLPPTRGEGQGQSANGVFWVIERSDIPWGPKAAGVTLYRSKRVGEVWTENIYHAAQFASRAGAETWWRSREASDPALRIVEHAWIASGETPGSNAWWIVRRVANGDARRPWYELSREDIAALIQPQGEERSYTQAEVDSILRAAFPFGRSNPPQEERSDPLDLAAADDNRPDVPRDEEGRDAYQIIADCNRQAMLRRAGVKDRSREPLLGPPGDMLVSRILLEALPDIDPKQADQLAVKITDALPADDNHKALVEALESVRDWAAQANPAGYGGIPNTVRNKVDQALAPFTTKETDHG